MFAELRLQKRCWRSDLGTFGERNSQPKASQVYSSNVRPGVQCIYPVGFNSSDVFKWDISVLLNPGVGCSTYHLPIKLHLGPKYNDLIMMRSIDAHVSS